MKNLFNMNPSDLREVMMRNPRLHELTRVVDLNNAEDQVNPVQAQPPLVMGDIFQKLWMPTEKNEAKFA